MESDLLLKVARLMGLLGIGLLTVSGVGGALLASRTAQKLKWLKGQTFKYHRTLSLIGASLLALHPFPMIVAHNVTKLTALSAFVPFLAPKQTLFISLGILAFYTLLVVTISSLRIKQMKRERWRLLHWGTYLFLALGLAHGIFISAEFREGETLELKEPQKILLLLTAALALALPVYRAVIARKKAVGATLVLLLVLPMHSEAQSPVSGMVVHGSFQESLNLSVLGKSNPSAGHRLNISYVPPQGGSWETRIEYYTDGSYNADQPGRLLHNINEPKFEIQAMYSRALAGPLGATVGGLQHENFRFPDHYFWGIAGLTYSKMVYAHLLFSGSALVQAKQGAGRAFYDLSGTLEYVFQTGWSAQASLHRYENLGQTDPMPTQKREVELAVNRSIGQGRTVGISLFSHVQYGAPNDQFRFVKVKYGFAF